MLKDLVLGGGLGGLVALFAKHLFDTLIENTRARHQLRMAAVDKRLQAHQEAFTLWHAMVTATDSTAAVAECSRWWNQNCLYLEPQVREAFLTAFSRETVRRELRSLSAKPEEIAVQLEKVNAFPQVLFQAIRLPPLSEDELGEVTKKAST